MKYVVLTNRAVPYLLARVRWPDIYQAISAGCPEWLDDPGLFDLPYDPSAVRVTFQQAAAVAAAWGTQLHPEAAGGAPSFIRRMPANWSCLSPAERRAFGIEHIGKRGRSGRLLRSRLTERRHARADAGGRAHIRWGHTTLSAGFANLSEGGMECVFPEALPLLDSGVKLDGPFLLEAEATTAQICLEVPGWVGWHRRADTVTHFSVAFDGLSAAQAEGIRRFVAAAIGKGAR